MALDINDRQGVTLLFEILGNVDNGPFHNLKNELIDEIPARFSCQMRKKHCGRQKTSKEYVGLALATHPYNEIETTCDAL